MLFGDGLDDWLGRIGPGGPEALMTDAVGSIFAAGNSSTGLTSQYTYEPFGNTAAVLTGGATSGSSVQFTGRENDGTGLYFYRARYLDPQTNRFLSEDIEARWGGINQYAYVNNDPIDFTDPLGLTACSEKPCDELLKEILNFAAELSKRFAEYKNPKWQLPLLGRNSRKGHIDQIESWQNGLRNRIKDYDDFPCPDPIPLAVQELATRPLPELTPSPTNLPPPPDARMVAAGLTGALLIRIIIIAALGL
jgi:RHS repeat-associated protein